MLADNTIYKINSQRYDRDIMALLASRRASCCSIAVMKRSKLVYRLAYGAPAPAGSEGRGANGQASGGALVEGSGASGAYGQASGGALSEGIGGNGAYGQASVDSVRADTRFNVGSVSKLVTGAAVMKLVETGQLTLDDPVARHIPEYRLPAVTVLHLLTHAAGYGADAVNGLGFPERQEDVALFLQRLYEIDTLARQPGQSSEYFTLGYTILMDVIERVSGLTFEKFVQTHIFHPAQMADSTFDPDTLGGKHYVLPWDDHSGVFLHKEAMTGVMGDRGLFTTAADLVRFGSVFLNGGVFVDEMDGSRMRLFSQAAVDAMLREATPREWGKTPVFWRKGNYDVYGCFGDLNAPEAVGHTGFTGCMLLIDPVYETVAALLTNSLNWHADWRNYRLLCNIVMSMQA